MMLGIFEKADTTVNAHMARYQKGRHQSLCSLQVSFKFLAAQGIQASDMSDVSWVLNFIQNSFQR